MAKITLGGTPCNTNGELPQKGASAPNFNLTKDDLSEVSSDQFAGKKVILNIFPSVDTAVCATSVRKFNEKANNLPDTVVLCVSKDLPFALKRFCAAEGLENVHALSDFKNRGFDTDYGVKIVDGGFSGLMARAVVVLDKEGKVTYNELVSEVGNEPNYDAAIAAL